MSDSKRETALKLQQAKRDFEMRIEESVRSYERDHEGPVEFDLSLADSGESADADEEHAALRQTIRTLVEAFQNHAIVQQTGVTVHKITAIDSDADGLASVNVLYDHPGYE